MQNNELMTVSVPMESLQDISNRPAPAVTKTFHRRPKVQALAGPCMRHQKWHNLTNCGAHRTLLTVHRRRQARVLKLATAAGSAAAPQPPAVVQKAARHNMGTISHNQSLAVLLLCCTEGGEAQYCTQQLCLASSSAERHQPRAPCCCSTCLKQHNKRTAHTQGRWLIILQR